MAGERIVVVGASLAGLRGVETLRREGFDGEIVVIGDEVHRPYDRPPLSKQVLTGEWPPEKTALPGGDEDHGAEWRLGVRAVRLDADARRVFAGKENLRLLLTGTMPDPRAAGRYIKPLAGGFLLQDRDAGHITADDLKIVTKREPSAREIADMLFAFTVGKHVKSNTIVYAKDGATVGIGAGQMSRVDAARIAMLKSREAAGAAARGSALLKI